MSLTEGHGHTWICRTQIKPNWARKTRNTIQKFILLLRKRQKTALVKLAYFQGVTRIGLHNNTRRCDGGHCWGNGRQSGHNP